MTTIDEIAVLKARAAELKFRTYETGEGGHVEVFFDIGNGCHLGRNTFTIFLSKLDEATRTAAEQVKASARVCASCTTDAMIAMSTLPEAGMQKCKVILYSRDCPDCHGKSVVFGEKK